MTFTDSDGVRWTQQKTITGLDDVPRQVGAGIKIFDPSYVPQTGTIGVEADRLVSNAAGYVAIVTIFLIGFLLAPLIADGLGRVF